MSNRDRAAAEQRVLAAIARALQEAGALGEEKGNARQASGAPGEEKGHARQASGAPGEEKEHARQASGAPEGKAPPRGAERAGVLCALSGGADSVALLWGLCALREKAGLFVCAAHLNHGLRGTLAARDEAFCRALCARAGVPLAVGAADCRALARAAGKGVEEAAREARYAFLFRAAEEAGCGWVLTAHHAGDQAETVLFHLLRGAGAAGLGGMPARRGRLLRPLLACKKADLLAVARGSGWGHVEDETNEDRTYARNRLRALGAEFAKINAGWEQNICRTAALLREDDEALCAWAARERAALAKGEGLDAGGLAALPAAVQGRVVRLLCKERGLGKDLQRAHVLAVCGLLKQGGKASLPCGLTAAVEGGVLSVGPRPAGQEEKAPGPGGGEGREAQDADGAGCCLPLALPGETATPWGVLFARRVRAPEGLSLRDRFCCVAPEGALVGAVVRQRRPGDVIFPLGGPGKKKLQDFYVDRKVPQALRRLPVVAVGAEVLFAVGAGVSERCRTQSGQPAVRLRFVEAKNLPKTAQEPPKQGPCGLKFPPD